MLSGNMSDDEMLPPSNNSTNRKSIKTSKQTVTNEILKSYQVTSFKYVDSKYENRGKIGLALIGNKSNSNFSLLLYGKGNAALSQANINKEFEVICGRDLYISFYDIKSENWSVLFETVEFYNDFLSRLTILKSISSKQDFISLDIKVGEGICVHDTDLCEVDIVVYCVKNCDIISALYASENMETNKITRLKVGLNKLMPVIDKSIIGMSKGGHRVICVSSTNSSLKGGSLKVANDVGIVAHLKILRIKTKTDKPTANNDSGDTELSLPDLNFGQGNKEVDNEASDQSKKTVLLNRMKIMGKPLLEFHPIDSSFKNPEVAVPVNSSVYGAGMEPTYNQPMIGNQLIYPGSHVPSYNNQIMPLHSAAPMMSTMHQSFQTLPNMVGMNDSNLVTTENRQHNSEMRIAISKLQDKIDRISDKLDTNVSIQKPSPSRHMDAESVFENIKRIIDENEIMKRECSQKSDTIDSQNKRINELLNRNQRYLEDSRDVGDRTSVTFSNMNSENQCKILKLEEEKLEFIRNLSKKTSELSQLEIKMESISAESQSYRNKSLEFNEQIDKLMTELGEIKLKNRSLSLELEKINEERLHSSSINEDLVTQKRLAMENERKLQHTIEQLKSHVKDEKNNTEKVKLECENEIKDIRQQCEKEIEELRNRLKNERKITSSKSINFDSEIESVNKVWDAKFEEFKQLESNKLSKMNERNNQLAMEKSSLTHELYELKDQLLMSNNVQSTKFEELLVGNKMLQRQLDEAQSKVHEIESLRVKHNNDEKEITTLKRDLESAVQRKLELESSVKTLTNELNVKPLSSADEKVNDLGVEQKIKSIMNDVFKKIKMGFELDQSYHGKDIVGKCMAIIRDSTVCLIKSSDGGNTEPQEDKSEEESTDSDNSDDDPDSDLDNNIENSIMVSESSPKDFPTVKLNNSCENLSEKEVEIVQSNNIGEKIDDHFSTEMNENGNLLQVEQNDDFREIFECGNNEIIILENDKNLLEVEQNSVLEERREIEVGHSIELDNNEIIILENEGRSNDPEKHVELNDFQDQIEDAHESEIEIIKKHEDVHLFEKHSDENDDATFSKDKFDPLPNIQTEEDSLDSGIITCPRLEDDQESNRNTDATGSNADESVPQSKSDGMKDDIDFENKVATNQNDESVENVKEKDNLFGSDDEDASAFFEELNKKRKNDDVKVVKPKLFTSDDDDDLNWLHS